MGESYMEQRGKPTARLVLRCLTWREAGRGEMAEEKG